MAKPDARLLKHLDALIDGLNMPLKDVLPLVSYYLGGVCAESGTYTQEEAMTRIVSNFEDGWTATIGPTAPPNVPTQPAPAEEPE